MAEAQKTAQEAAVKARALATQASVHAKVLAEQATVQAKVLAERAAEEAQKLNQMSATNANQSRAPAVNPEELARFGVDASLLEFISTLTYTMFSDLKGSAVTGSSGGAAMVEVPLTPWQERHAVLVLGQAPHLQGLRFALCPRHMSDSLFWSIYFQLAKDVLPSERDRDAVMAAAAAAATPAPTSTSTVAADVQQKASAALTGAGNMLGSLLRNTQTLLASQVTQQGAGASGGGVMAAPASAGSAVGTATAGMADTGTQQVAAADVRGVVSVTSHTSLVSGSLLNMSDAAAADRQGEDLSDPGSLGPDGLPHDGVSRGSVDDDDDNAFSEPLGDLGDDPELEAYLQEALAVDEDDVDGDGAQDGMTDLESAAEDLDDYITQLDAELAAGSKSEQSTPHK